MPAYALMLSCYYYAENYAGIIRKGLGRGREGEGGGGEGGRERNDRSPSQGVPHVCVCGRSQHTICSSESLPVASEPTITENHNSQHTHSIL